MGKRAQHPNLSTAQERSMRLRTIATAGLPALVALALLAGCGSSSNGDSSSTTSGSSGSAIAGGAYGGAAAPKTTASTPAAGGKATVKTARTPLGTILVDGSGRALYLWEADTGSSSTCDGACAQSWPPLTTSGSATAAGGARSGMLGTTRRSDGTLQVTYAGHPLYYYAGDTAPGQTTGQDSDGFGAEWYVVTPAGTADKKDA